MRDLQLKNQRTIVKNLRNILSDLGIKSARFTGAKAQIWINGVEVAYVSDVTYTIESFTVNLNDAYGRSDD